mgnify:CR=1 FL=1
MSATKIHLNATFWRLGSEVWIEAECGMCMIPPDSPTLAEIPPSALHADPQLDRWVAELRSGAAGPRLAVSFNDAAQTATIGGIDVNYHGVRMILSMWEGHPLHWHVRGETARALWKGKAVAEVRLGGGVAAEAARVIEVDGRLWATTAHICLCVEGERAEILRGGVDSVQRTGNIIAQARALFVAPLGPRYEPKVDGDGVWIGPARLQAMYHGIIESRFHGCAWHATGPVDPVKAVRDGNLVAIVMPAPLSVKGGAS